VNDVGRILAALADDTRRTIVGQLAAGATPTATELARDLPISRQAVAKHLKVLEDAEVVVAHRRGREARYELRPDPLATAGEWLDEVAATWESRLDRLRTRAEQDAGRRGPDLGSPDHGTG
jgi:DNA-binding transcriptional ArsR family regulator